MYPVEIKADAAARLGVPPQLTLAERPGGERENAPWIDYHGDRAVLHLIDGRCLELAVDDILMVRD